MAVVKDTIKSALMALYNDANSSPMSAETFADNMAGIIKDAILSADVVAGIPVSTTGTAVAQTGATTAKGSLA